MLQAFVIVLREGFEAFLIVAIISIYLRKTLRFQLLPAVYWGTGVSVLSSALFGYWISQGINGPLWEGILGLCASVMVGWLVVHMWRTAPYLKRKMENQLSEQTTGKTTVLAWLGVFIFTTLMITREGMETAFLLISVHTDSQMVSGILMGIIAAAAMAYAWARFGHLINLTQFFQVTAIFLSLFVVQIFLYSLHEFTEAGILPNSEILHEMTETFSSEGPYGKWFSLGMVVICAGWLCVAWIKNRFLSGLIKNEKA